MVNICSGTTGVLEVVNYEVGQLVDWRWLTYAVGKLEDWGWLTYGVGKLKKLIAIN